MVLKLLLAMIMKMDGNGMSNNKEIEHKFLVSPAFAKTLIGGNFERIDQFYLTEGYNPTVRIRICDNRDAYITIKGKANGTECPEFEYKIPVADAIEMRDTLPHTPIVSKFRYRVPSLYCDKVWEVDIFHDDNEGLYIAEIELKYKDEEFVHPPWILREVTHDHKYKNICLALSPYTLWDDAAKDPEKYSAYLSL